MHAPQTDAPPFAGAERTAGLQSAPTQSRCLNCGTALTREYCPECGQRSIDPNPTLRELAHELAEGFLNWDGKLLGTLRLLVTAPGALTREYLAGRRVRYISPLRVYLTCALARGALISAAYFVIFTMTFLALFVLSVFLV